MTSHRSGRREARGVSYFFAILTHSLIVAAPCAGQEPEPPMRSTTAIPPVRRYPSAAIGIEVDIPHAAVREAFFYPRALEGVFYFETDTGSRSDDQTSERIRMERMHGVGGKTVVTRVGLEFPAVESAQSAVGTDPQVSGRVLEKCQTLRLRQPIPVRVVLKIQNLSLGSRCRDQLHAERDEGPLPNSVPSARL